MREHIISELTKELLGPHDGRPDERLDGDGPYYRYMTGILAPEKTENQTTLTPIMAPPGEPNEDTPISIDGELSPPTSPGDIPSTMGISFIVESESPEFSVCITWARYTHSTVSGQDRWQRVSRTPFIKKIALNDPTPIFIGSSGVEVPIKDAEIALHVSIASPDSEEKRAVDLRMRNLIKYTSAEGNNSQFQRFYIFQPEMRVVCEEGTRIVPGFDPNFTDSSKYQSEIDEKQMLEILYRNRKVYAKGHLVSAVWNDPDDASSVTDCQTDKPDTSNLDIPASGENPANAIPFVWTDGAAVSDKRFHKPDVRTEFIPLYSIPKPELLWEEINQQPDGSKYCSDLPELHAAELAETWDHVQLRKKLMPLYDGYATWVRQVEQTLDALPNDRGLTRGLISDKCAETLDKIEKGIDMLCSDTDDSKRARLAFCFANKAIDMQYGWNNKDEQGNPKPFEYYPFQLAFILATIESISDPTSTERDVCDLLWVPTGGGKTEAYLVLTAFLLGYRRRREIQDNRTGAGVAVVTRYTLRLLSVQQFRRMLAIIMSCEKLRVAESNGHRGWRPTECGIQSGLIWGAIPFSLGLWLGRGMTPNKLKGNSRQQYYQAIENVKSLEIPDGGGDPCQVTNCPACNSVLSIPNDAENSGLDAEKPKTIFLTVEASDTEVDQIRQGGMNARNDFTINVVDATRSGRDGDYAVIELSVTAQQITRTAKELTTQIIASMQDTLSISYDDAISKIQSSRADKPGYFLRTYINRNGRDVDYDFEIICPNPRCPLADDVSWFSGAPRGSVHGHNQRLPQHLGNLTNIATGITLADRNNNGDTLKLTDVQSAFESSAYISQRIPISAYTVDDQVYGKTPSVVIATVDKFARPPFEAKAGNIFGNVTGHHSVLGYYREDAKGGGHPEPGSGTVKNYVNVERHHPPELIIQDELHLIEGPVGSMVGLYETAFDYLCGERVEHGPKYIASTATVRRAEEQILCTFNRRFSMFPPNGDSYGKRFFVKEEEAHALDSKKSKDNDKPGRLYMGVLAAGRGAHTPAIRMWSRNATTIWEQRDTFDDDLINKFWTQTGYFNASKELAAFAATYTQDIPERMELIAAGGTRVRKLDDDRRLEISSRAAGLDSSSLPVMLDKLQTRYSCDRTGATTQYNIEESPDSMMGTAMIGTGIDIARINLMTVFGQPKMISQYIQATGRVGRTDASLVVTFYQAAKPRDLSHYEMFMGQHRQIQRFVEAPTVYPFSQKNMLTNMGPVLVYMLRNKDSTSHNTRMWGLDDSAIEMAGYNGRNFPEITDVCQYIEDRAQDQHPSRMPIPATRPGGLDRSALAISQSHISSWTDTAVALQNNNQVLDYWQWRRRLPNGQMPDWHSEVLGDIEHQVYARTHPEISVVYENSQQSLREVEEETHIWTSNDSVQGVRTSQFIIGMGPGYILQPKSGISLVVPDLRVGLFTDDFLATNYPQALERTFRIADAQIESALASLQHVTRAAMYQIPTNTELKSILETNPATGRERQEDDAIINANPFPNYYVCSNKSGHLHDVRGSPSDYSVLFRHDGSEPHCPICSNNNSHEIISSWRFLLSCPEGHMDNIDWDYQVHHDPANPSSGRCPQDVTHHQDLNDDGRDPPSGPYAIRYVNTSGGAGAQRVRRSGLDALTYLCPRCNASKSMQDIYKSKSHFCDGRYPENEPIRRLQGGRGAGRHRPDPCRAQAAQTPQGSMEVIQKAASFLRSVETITMLSVGNKTPIEEIISGNFYFRQACSVFEDNYGQPQQFTLQNLEPFMATCTPGGAQECITDEDATELRRDPNATLRAINERKDSLPESFDELLDYEFDQLLKGSVRGAPPSRGTGGGTGIRARFQMIDHHRQIFPDPEIQHPEYYYLINDELKTQIRKRFLVSSVDDLTTVTIQTSYKRDRSEDIGSTNPGPRPTSVPVNFNRTQTDWFPSVQFQGEGIFIRFMDDGETELSDPKTVAWTDRLVGTRADEWHEALANGMAYDSFCFRNKDKDDNVSPSENLSKMYELEPEFVWWHTFAHALIKTIQDSAGYSNTAIRERVYFEPNENGKVRGGILLYVTQPGADGTLGGLVGLIPSFDVYINGAIDLLNTCSSDPICQNAQLQPTHTPFGGCACFGCVMNSETSCDIRNFYLDREIFKQNRLERRS